MYNIGGRGRMTPGVEMKGSELAINMLTTYDDAWSGNEGVRISLFLILINVILTTD